MPQELDDTEPIRRAEQAQLNAHAAERRVLEERHGQVWTKDELSAEFELLQFAAPYVIVRRLADNAIGSVMFQHMPRYYFKFEEDK